MQQKNIFTKGVMDKDTHILYVKNENTLHAENMRFFNDGENFAAVNIQGNVQVSEMISNMENPLTVAAVENVPDSKIYYFVSGDTSDKIIEFDKYSQTSTVVLFGDKEHLGFEKSIIHGVNFIDGLLYWSQKGKPPRKINVERAKNYGYNNFDEDDISVIKAPPQKEPQITMLNTSSQLENDLEDRFISFAYRYKYLDSEYSAISFYSDIAFFPKKFALTYDDLDNDGMLNLFNSCRITFITGDHRVTDIDLIFRETNSNTAYIVQSFNKQKEGWGNNTSQHIDFFNNKLFTAISENDTNLLYDNVPLTALSQDFIGNALVYANYTEGFNQINKFGKAIIPKFTVDIDTQNISENQIPKYISKESVTPSYAEFDFYSIFGFLLKDAIIVLDLTLSPISGYNGTEDIIFTTYNNAYAYMLPEDYDSIGELFITEGFQTFLNSIKFDFESKSLNANQEFYSLSNIEFTLDGNKIKLTAPHATVTVTLPDGENNEEDPTVSVDITWSFSQNSFAYMLQETVTKSVKSYRSYEVVIAYYDKYNRLVSVLDCETNTVFNPHENADNKNTLKITIHHLPPKNAVKFKFGIKQTKSDYETLYSWIYYLEGQYAWLKLEGSNKQKVHDGDTLILKYDSGEFVSTPKTVKVLEVVNQNSNFIEDNYIDNDENKELIEQAGLYMKIRRSGTSIGEGYQEPVIIDQSKGQKETFKLLVGKDDNTGGSFSNLISGNINDATGIYEDIVIYKGATVSILLENYKHTGWYAGFNKTKIATKDYANIKEFCEEELFGSFGVFGKDSDTLGNGRYYEWVRGYIATKSILGMNVPVFIETGNPQHALFLRLSLMVNYDSVHRRYLHAKIILENASGLVAFETMPKYEDDYLFYETVGTYDIIDGYHENQRPLTELYGAPIYFLASYYNCYTYANGIESYKIKDSFNERALSFKFRPLTTLQEGYSEKHRKTDIIHSDFYNAETRYNGLSRFNSATLNWKTLPLENGEIQRIKARNSDLLVLQEHQTSKVLFGKSVLYNAEGIPTVQQVSDVLGQLVFLTNFGTRNPESLAWYADYYYWVDAKNGSMISLVGDSSQEINILGLNNEFMNICKQNSNFHGCFDVENNEYLVKYSSIDFAKIIAFQRQAQGYTSFYTFIPDLMLCSDKILYSWKQGIMYRHHDSLLYNHFYGEQHASEINVVANDNPFIDKVFQNIRIESTHVWDIKFKTNLNNTYLNKEEFMKKESYFVADIPKSVSADHQSSYGIGVVQAVEGDTITVKGIPVNMSVGDTISTLESVAVGIITDVSANFLKVSPPPQISVGTFIYGNKNKRIDGEPMRGCWLRIDMKLNTSDKTLLAAIDTEVKESKLN
jgi:hypothetical protein